jgi:hypothetical protein
MKKHNEYSFINTTGISNSTSDHFTSLTAGAGENPKAAGGSRQTLCGGSPSAHNGMALAEELKAAVLKDITDKGYAVSDFNLVIDTTYLGHDHRDVLWYKGNVVVLTHLPSGFTAYLDAAGEVDVTLMDEACENELCNARNNHEPNGVYEALREFIANDDELHKASEDNRLVFTFNNWWEIFYEWPDGHMDQNRESELIASDDIYEAILELADSLVEFVESHASEAAEASDEAFYNDATAIHFARCWGVEIGKLEGRKAFFPLSEARWNLMRNLPSDELSALMHKWAEEYNAEMEYETLDDFFSMKLAELFKKEGM